MFGFSNKLLITNIFNIINNNLFSVLLGKFYNENEVGNYTQANKWNGMGHTTVTGMINSIAQPVLTGISDDATRQLAVFPIPLPFPAFVSFPAMLGLSFVSKEFILITITDKWLASANILQLLCIWGAFIPICSLFSNLIISRGRSSIYMINTITLSILQLITACIIYPYGINWMLRILEPSLTLKDMIKDISPYLLLSVALIILAYYITLPITNIYLNFIAKIIIVAGGYGLVLWKMKSVIFRECINFILRKRQDGNI